MAWEMIGAVYYNTMITSSMYYPRVPYSSTTLPYLRYLTYLTYFTIFIIIIIVIIISEYICTRTYGTHVKSPLNAGMHMPSAVKVAKTCFVSSDRLNKPKKREKHVGWPPRQVTND